MSVRIVPLSRRGYRGRRARRAAFYARSRVGRLLSRILRRDGANSLQQIQEAYIDALAHGLGVVLYDGTGATLRIDPLDVLRRKVGRTESDTNDFNIFYDGRQFPFEVPEQP